MVHKRYCINFGKFLRLFLLFLIRVYQYCLSPLFVPVCRFVPTCSEYAYQAIERHGIFKGSFMAIVRIMKCHPFHPGGYDPVK